MHCYPHFYIFEIWFSQMNLQFKNKLAAMQWKNSHILLKLFQHYFAGKKFVKTFKFKNIVYNNFKSIFFALEI